MAPDRDTARRRLQRVLGHDFGDRGILDEALTHRSAGSANNERLEFLGDALLNSVVAIELFRRRPQAPEGELTRLRTALVRTETLAAVAGELGLGAALIMGEGERRSGGHQRESILADGVEALVGAVFIDSDFETARRVIVGLLGERFDTLPGEAALKDAKTRLQEYLQARREALPSYEVIEVSGADHAQQFRVRCRVEAHACERTGVAGSRRKAEQRAARACLEALGAA